MIFEQTLALEVSMSGHPPRLTVLLIITGDTCSVFHEEKWKAEMEEAECKRTAHCCPFQNPLPSDSERPSSIPWWEGHCRE